MFQPHIGIYPLRRVEQPSAVACLRSKICEIKQQRLLKIHHDVFRRITFLNYIFQKNGQLSWHFLFGDAQSHVIIAQIRLCHNIKASTYYLDGSHCVNVWLGHTEYRSGWNTSSKCLAFHSCFHAPLSMLAD